MRAWVGEESLLHFTQANAQPELNSVIRGVIIGGTTNESYNVSILIESPIGTNLRDRSLPQFFVREREREKYFCC